MKSQIKRHIHIIFWLVIIALNISCKKDSLKNYKIEMTTTRSNYRVTIRSQDGKEDLHNSTESQNSTIYVKASNGFQLSVDGGTTTSTYNFKIYRDNKLIEEDSIRANSFSKAVYD